MMMMMMMALRLLVVHRLLLTTASWLLEMESPVSLVISGETICYGVESKTGKTLWNIHIDSLREFNITMKEPVQESLFIAGSTVTVGWKLIYVLHVDPHTGELHNCATKYFEPEPEPDECKNLMLIVRTSSDLNFTEDNRNLSMHHSDFHSSIYSCNQSSAVQVPVYMLWGNNTRLLLHSNAFWDENSALLIKKNHGTAVAICSLFILILVILFIKRSLMNRKITATTTAATTIATTTAVTTTATARKKNRKKCRNKKKNASVSEDDERSIGKLSWNGVIIGKGSSGTVVYEGVYNNRPVAVKRMVRVHSDIANDEINHLIRADHHSNMVRYYGKEDDRDFVYIALERCNFSLSDFISYYSRDPLSPEGSTYEFPFKLTDAVNFTFQHEDIQIWDEDGFPSVRLIKLIRGVVNGLVHLHSLSIIHRDIKPQNIMINYDGSNFIAKLSDMGISKHLINVSSMTYHSAGFHSYRWLAPEQVDKSRLSVAVDLFGLGWIMFFCLTKGMYPFNCKSKKLSNLLKKKGILGQMPEATDLISKLLDQNPKNRPSAEIVIAHPFFWSAGRRLTFLQLTSDKIELEAPQSDFLKDLEKIQSGRKWGNKLDPKFFAHMCKRRNYDTDSTRDLLRIIRNTASHHLEISANFKGIIGSNSNDLDHYFKEKFPELLIEVYEVVYFHCMNEDSFSTYLGPSPDSQLRS